MGLQNQLNDVSSDSIPLLLFSLIAKCFDHLRSYLFIFFRLSRFIPSSVSVVDDGLLASMGSGLAGLILLSEQLNLNRVFSYTYCSGSSSGGGGGGGGGSDCMVCLCRFRDGDHVRMLDCRHVFHKECFDGWLDHLNFNCPLCRFPLVSDQRVDATRRRVGGELVDWFSVQ